MGSSPVPFAGLRQWGDVALRARLSGGHRSVVYLADLGGRPVVVRRSLRPVDALEWELDLLDHLASQGLAVPTLVLTGDGRRQVDGVTVQEFVAGDPPRSRRDWGCVAATLHAVHESTVGWPQRPGFASSQHLLTGDRGGDVRLDQMPAHVVTQVRAAWTAVQHGEPSVVHGDPAPANIRMADGQAVLLDWDEARVDVVWFDLAFLPTEIGLPDGLDRCDVESAGIAWEAATCWIAEPSYARTRAEALAQRQRERAGG